MIVYHADRLHVRINQGRTNKTESTVCIRGNADEPLSASELFRIVRTPASINFSRYIIIY